MQNFSYKMQVFWEDVDRFGIVHHTNYIKFMERARLDWWLQMGVRLDDLYDLGFFLLIKRIEIDYLSPAYLYDKLEILSTIVSQKRIQKTYEQTIRSDIEPQKIFCHARIQVVCVNDKMRPTAMPRELVEKLK